ncbi:MAG: hypothetical protein ACKOAU_04250 [Pirellula sp.]
MSENPFEPSAGAFGSIREDISADLTQAELIRKSHLSHEANIQSFGCLYTLWAILQLLFGAFYTVAGIVVALYGSQVLESGEEFETGSPLTAGLITVALGVFFLALGTVLLLGGRAMQTLNSKHKMLAIIISAIGLLGFPCVTIPSAYLLYLLLSPKGEMVFSEGYKDIVRATPHIKYRTSIIVWIMLFLLIGVIAFFIIGGVMSSNRF